MAAVAGDQESLSYGRSPSNAFRGSYFIGAIADTLRQTQSTSGSYRELCAQIQANLGQLFPLLMQHSPPVFSAQADNWDGRVTQMTGLAQTSYARLYDALPDYHTSTASGSSVHATAGARGLQVLIAQYLNCKPGLENLASNQAIAGRIAHYTEPHPNQGPMSPESQGWLCVALLHRIRLARCAAEYLKLLTLTPFPSFDTWDLLEWESNHQRYLDTAGDAYRVLQKFHLLLPDHPAISISGYRTWPKPKRYLAAAAAAKGIDQLALHRRCTLLYKFIYPGMPISNDDYTPSPRPHRMSGSARRIGG